MLLICIPAWQAERLRQRLTEAEAALRDAVGAHAAKEAASVRALGHAEARAAEAEAEAKRTREASAFTESSLRLRLDSAERLARRRLAMACRATAGARRARPSPSPVDDERAGEVVDGGCHGTDDGTGGDGSAWSDGVCGVAYGDAYGDAQGSADGDNVGGAFVDDGDDDGDDDRAFGGCGGSGGGGGALGGAYATRRQPDGWSGGQLNALADGGDASPSTLRTRNVAGCMGEREADGFEAF